jgi:hypothetical protein
VLALTRSSPSHNTIGSDRQEEHVVGRILISGGRDTWSKALPADLKGMIGINRSQEEGLGSHRPAIL